MVRPKDAVQWALYYPPLFDYRTTRLTGPDSPTLTRVIQRYEQGYVFEALTELDTVSTDRRDVPYFTLRAGMLLSIGRVDYAQADISDALNVNPDNGVDLDLLSVIALVNNDNQEALQPVHRAVERAPDSAIPGIALSYAQQGAFQIVQASGSAQDAAQLAVERNDKLSCPHTILGFVRLTALEFKKAATAFQQAIALDQADPLPRLGLGLAKIRQNDLEAGRRKIEIATSLDLNNSIMRSYLGKSYFEEKRRGLDETQYEMPKELDPHDPTPWFYDAIREQFVNKPIEALHDYQESIRLNDDRAVYRGRLLLHEDVATRGATVGRNNNLGFDQRGKG
ncbi:MAG: hypothetical protein NPIRA06_06580 [Nitrospirales bacterium]|nr:MAG: hypothetical protein NPIRA06_06580 [Nitrospirales bacterium]